MPGIIEDLEILNIKHFNNELRSDYDDIRELAESIGRNGLLHPIIVRATDDKYFEIVAGNRRFDACKALGWKKIACHIMNIVDKDAFEIALIENIQRKNLQPLDEARAFKIYVTDFGWGGVTELASKLNKSASYITKRMMLLNLPADIHDSMNEGSLTVSAAEELMSIKDSDKQSDLGKLIRERHLTVKKARRLLKDLDEESYSFFQDKKSEEVKRAQRSFDKSIITLRLAMNGIASIIEDVEDIWALYEILMHNKNVLHDQIDLLLKHRRKLVKQR